MLAADGDLSRASSHKTSPMPRRPLQLRLQSIGDFPDGGWGAAPDGRTTLGALGSGMSPLTESLRADTDADIVIIETRATLRAAPAGWRPAINAYRCEGRFLVFADLSGVPPESIRLEVSPDRVVIRGTRPPPEPTGEGAHTCQLIALEIDHGTFERVLDLPQAVNPDDVTTEYRDGVYRIALGLRT